jgi:hypothetical protein
VFFTRILTAIQKGERRRATQDIMIAQ